MSEPTLAKQRRYQARRHKAGICQTCSNPLTTYSHHCDLCYRKLKPGFAPWKPGSPGRPPLSSYKVKKEAA